MYREEMPPCMSYIVFLNPNGISSRRAGSACCKKIAGMSIKIHVTDMGWLLTTPVCTLTKMLLKFDDYSTWGFSLYCT
jgi:hypothetical protein